MEDDDPLMLAAEKALGERVSAHTRGKRFTASLLRDIEQIIYDHRARARSRGIDFPELVVLGVPRIGALSLYRRDLEREGLRAAVLNFVKLHPRVTPGEVAMAVRRAWPHVKPGDLVDEARIVAAKVIERSPVVVQ